MKRLSVLQVSHSYEGPFVKVCNQYTAAFQDHHVTTLFLKGERNAEVEARVGGDEVIFLEQSKSSLRGMKFGSMLLLARLLKQSSYDVVVAHRYKAIYLVGVMSFFFNLPVIIGVAHEHEVFRRIARKLFVTFWRRKIIVAGVSRSVVSGISRYCPSLSSQNRLFILPNAVNLDHEKLILPRDEARRVLGLPADEFVIGTVGRLVAKKNHRILIQAFSEINEPARLLIIGDGPEKSELRSMVEQFGLGNKVVFAGYRENADRLVRAVDIFVLPSGSEEAFGLVLLEAMLARIPILSSDAAGPKEVLADQAVLFRRGNVSDLVEKLICLMKQSVPEMLSLGERGYRRVVEHYGYERFRQQLWQLPDLSRLLENSSPS